MKTGQQLRIIRIIISVAVGIALTLLWTEYGDAALRSLGWIEHGLIVGIGCCTVGILQLLFWLTVSSLFGRIYCSAICPLGTWFDLLSHISRASRRALGLPDHYSYSLPYNRTRVAILAAAVVCLAAGFTLPVMLVEPDSVWHNVCQSALKPLWGHVNNMLATVSWPASLAHKVVYVSVVAVSSTAIALSLVTLLAVSIPAIRYGRAYCNTVCPVGTALSVTARYSHWRVDIDTDLCINCGRCSDECKSSCIDLRDHTVDMSRCVVCYDCLPVCPNNAITYRNTRKQLSWPLMQKVSPTLNVTENIQTDETISRSTQPCDE